MVVNHITYCAMAFTLLAGFSSTKLYGKSLPESFFPSKSKTKYFQQDSELSNWMKDHFDIDDVTEGSKNEMTRSLKGKSEGLNHFINLRFAIKNNRSIDGAIKKAKEYVKPYLAKDNEQENFYVPFLINEMIQSESLSDQDKKDFVGWFRGRSEKTCSDKEFILSQIEANSGTNSNVKLTSQEFIKYFDRIDQFDSATFKIDALDELFRSLPKESVSELPKEVVSKLSENHVLRKRHDVLAAHYSSTMQTDARLEKIKKYKSKRLCTRAKNILFQTLERDKIDLDLAVEAAQEVEKCYSRISRKRRISFLKTSEEKFSKKFGIEGLLEIKHRTGLVSWWGDEFDQARESFLSVYSLARSNGKDAYAAKALYTLARVEENAGDTKKSLEYFSKFRTEFKDHELFAQSLRAEVILYFHNDQFEDALNASKLIIERDNKLDNVEDSDLSFALYWSGRAYLQLSKTELAKEMFRRCAMEFYSSFYGAMGHYMLEQVVGDKLVLEPSNSPKFGFDVLLKGFDAKERTRIEGIVELLSVGQSEEASCELVEMNFDSQDPNRQLAKSLILRASGNYLSAIKVYTALSRDFRRAQPRGMEKILFPVKYLSRVKYYSEQAKIDPAWVLGVMRQESVFNPQAHSGAGARGLMQLMPATAKLEGRMLARSYLTRSKRAKLKRLSRSRRNLFDPEINMGLGIHHLRRLMKKYDNPILVMAAYNASPRAAEKWKVNLATKDPMVFIERIPYQETKDYVKLILRNYFYYKRFYNLDYSNTPHLQTVTSFDVKAISENKKSL